MQVKLSASGIDLMRRFSAEFKGIDKIRRADWSTLRGEAKPRRDGLIDVVWEGDSESATK